jgi:hypothetical protein
LPDFSQQVKNMGFWNYDWGNSHQLRAESCIKYLRTVAEIKYGMDTSPNYVCEVNESNKLFNVCNNIFDDILNTTPKGLKYKD